MTVLLEGKIIGDAYKDGYKETFSPAFLQE